MPADADVKPVPAIIEYLPYRKRGGTEARDMLTHPYLAGHGYVCLRVDIVGNGESDGVMSDEYTQQELNDGVDIINWIARQKWCDGSVGMMGISWGGFNALQIAALQPDPLKAIITLCSTDDRYADDIHYKGGCLLNENLGWGATMLAYSSRPPDPAIVGECWREMWLNRLHNQTFLPAIWLQHQCRDDYWRHGSICENYSKIKAATLVIGGWGDAYKNAVWRIVDQLDAPAKGIIGPWLHKYPHFAAPLPQIGFLQEALRWWDCYLKGQDTGVAEEAAMRVYVMDSVRPKTSYTKRSGRWVACENWPPRQADYTILHFCPDKKLSEQPGRSLSVSVSSPQSCGADAGEYCAIWLGPDMPGDQRRDDAYSACFDTDTLTREHVIAGRTRVSLQLKLDKPIAQIALRLNDVWPDGAITRITYGVLNLSHRDSHESPSYLVAGEEYAVHLYLDDIAYAVPVGHRLRLSLSSSYWPLIWPSPAPVTVEVLGGSIEYRNMANVDLSAVVFPPAEAAPAQDVEVIRQSSNSRRVEIDQDTGSQRITMLDDFGFERDLSSGLECGSTAEESWSISPDDPLTATAQTIWSQVMQRNDWQTTASTSTRMQSDASYFYLQAKAVAYENGNKIFEKTWDEKIARQYR